MDQQIRVLVASGVSGPDQKTRNIVRLLIKADGAAGHAATYYSVEEIVKNVLQPDGSSCFPDDLKEVHQATVCWKTSRHFCPESTADIVSGIARKDDIDYWKLLRDPEVHLSQHLSIQKSVGDWNHRFFGLQENDSLGKKMRNSCMKN